MRRCFRSSHFRGSQIIDSARRCQSTEATRYNELAQYWLVDIYKNDAMVYAGLPLVPGQNILEQVGYLGIGSAWIAPRSRVMEQWPSAATLTSDWYVIWGDSNGGDK